MEYPHDGCMCAVSGTENTSFGSAAVAYVGDLYEHAVSVHGGTDGMGRDKNVARNSSFQVHTRRGEIRNHKAEAVAMQAQFPGELILPRCSSGDRVAVRIDEH